MQRQVMDLAADPRDGSTLVLALSIQPHAEADPSAAALVAHVGDSAAIGCAMDGTATRLTTDHAPDREDESARIQAAGGCVTRRSAHGVPRLQVWLGCFVAY